ncbi:hypothetical protein CI105_07005 [Candidatus Izimaplasma bacterium ZiA1]|uniref:hypothetical protein n=1 Tax=Candidatus Izimoplasma sp. ZiA1 TaxID=2024899 RepID=UPI000BAA5C8B|nr:hypothetical protein CI105_07005 [Candidatus Izimaplasma bacterium ZiA1]
MNVLKYLLVVVSGAGFSLGVDKLVEADVNVDNYQYEDGYNYQGGYGHCFEDELFLDHMLSNLSPEDKILVDAKISDLSMTYNTTIEDVIRDYDLHYAFMNDLMNYMDESNIDYHNHEYDDQQNNHHRRMH